MISIGARTPVLRRSVVGTISKVAVSATMTNDRCIAGIRDSPRFRSRCSY